MSENADRIWRAFTPEQRADAENFAAFWDEWSQRQADFTPDEWARAEGLRSVVEDVVGESRSVRFWAEWLRACELYDATAEAEA